MSLVKDIIKESLPVLLLTTIGGVIAGLLSEHTKIQLAEIPGLLILLPAILGMRGNISGALGSRLGSALHLGLISPELKWNKTLHENTLASLILNISMSLILGVVAYFFYIFAGLGYDASIIKLTAISLIAGTLAGIILTGTTIILALVTYGHGLDPDNVLMPSLSTIGDIVTVICLLLAVNVVSYF
jgi:mgtE-like transporter